MKKFILTIFALFFASILYPQSIDRINAENDKLLADSFNKIALKLSPDERQDFSNASAILMYYGSKNGFNETQMRKIFNNKTASELVEAAIKVCPANKNEDYKMDASSKPKFSESLVVMLMNLPLKKQRQLTSAIAQAMLLWQMNERDESSLLKELDKKTAAQIIEQFGNLQLLESVKL